MKNIIPAIILIFVLSNSAASFAQCCPYIDTINVGYSNFSGNRNLEFFTKVTTPSSATTRINKSFFTRNDTVFLSGCYGAGPLQTLGVALDTFRIGFLNPGTYTIHFQAFISYNQTICNSSQSQIKTQTFIVSNHLGINAEEAVYPVFYPNPVKDVFWIHGELIRKVLITNLLGEIIKTERVNSETKHQIDLEFLPNGLYLLEITDKNGTITRNKILKE